MDSIAERIALNEALFREVNENILKASNDGRHPDAQFVCECGERNCEERVTLTVDQYRRARADELHFFCKPGHEIPLTEEVVERHDRYVVVEKPPEVLPLLHEE